MIMATDRKAMHEWFEIHRDHNDNECPECKVTPGKIRLAPFERMFPDGRDENTKSPEPWLNQLKIDPKYTEVMVQGSFFPDQYKGIWSRMDDGSWSHETGHHYMTLESAVVVYKNIRDNDGKVLLERVVEPSEYHYMYDIPDSVCKDEKYIAVLEGEEIYVHRLEFKSLLMQSA